MPEEQDTVQNNEPISEEEISDEEMDDIELDEADNEENYYDLDENTHGVPSGSTRGGMFFSPGATFVCSGRTSFGGTVNLILSLAFLLFLICAFTFRFFPLPGLGFLIITTLILWTGFILHNHQKHQSEISGGRIFLASFSVITFWFPLLISTVFGFGFVMQRTWMSNDTMLPGIHKGDYVLVDRLTFLASAPKHGDLVLVEDEVDEGRGPYKRAYFARVIAKPGDTIQLKGGVPYVNEKSLAHFIPDKAQLKTTPPNQLVTFYEVPANVVVEPDKPSSMPAAWYPILATADQFLAGQTISLTLEDEQYFVLEDNRDDTGFRHIRTSYGSIVHETRIKGQPRYILYNSLEPNGFDRFGYRLR